MENAAAHLPVLAKLGIGYADVALAVANGALTHLALMNEVTHRTAPLRQVRCPKSETWLMLSGSKHALTWEYHSSVFLSRTFGLRTIALSA